MEHSGNIPISSIPRTLLWEYSPKFYSEFFQNIPGIYHGNVPRIFREHIFARCDITPSNNNTENNDPIQNNDDNNNNDNNNINNNNNNNNDNNDNNNNKDMHGTFATRLPRILAAFVPFGTFATM